MNQEFNGLYVILEITQVFDQKKKDAKANHVSLIAMKFSEYQEGKNKLISDAGKSNVKMLVRQLGIFIPNHVEVLHNNLEWTEEELKKKGIKLDA